MSNKATKESDTHDLTNLVLLTEDIWTGLATLENSTTEPFIRVTATSTGPDEAYAAEDPRSSPETLCTALGEQRDPDNSV
jgi:hypothetical protein